MVSPSGLMRKVEQFITRIDEHPETKVYKETARRVEVAVAARDFSAVARKHSKEALQVCERHEAEHLRELIITDFATAVLGKQRAHTSVCRAAREYEVLVATHDSQQKLHALIKQGKKGSSS